MFTFTEEILNGKLYFCIMKMIRYLVDKYMLIKSTSTTLNYVLNVFSVSNGEIIIVGGTKLWIFLMFSLLNMCRLSK